MRMRIDDKTGIPLKWFISSLSASVTLTIFISKVMNAATKWESSVDYRLQRIEEKLSIPPFHADTTESRIMDALDSKKVYADPR